MIPILLFSTLEFSRLLFIIVNLIVSIIDTRHNQGIKEAGVLFLLILRHNYHEQSHTVYCTYIIYSFYFRALSTCPYCVAANVHANTSLFRTFFFSFDPVSCRYSRYLVDKMHNHVNVQA